MTGFVTDMVAARTQTTADIKRAIREAGIDITLPASLPADLQRRLDDLAKVNAANFGKCICSLMSRPIRAPSI